MKVLAVNGSPRTKCNTATLLNYALEGAASQGAESELVHLYDLDCKGCISCGACKEINGKSYGRCAVNDGLTPVLRKVEEVDALVLGSPIYFADVTGEMRSFMERLLFPALPYDTNHSTLIKTGLIYTMNQKEDVVKQIGWDLIFRLNEMITARKFGQSESLIVYDTILWADYSKYVSMGVDVKAKARMRKEEFPKDCQKAFDMGVRFAQIQG
ncbi:MAG: flavodoxin family protein [Halobacteriota archaeon]